MLTEQQTNRLRELQVREETLNSVEGAELEALLQTVEAREAEYLRPANERLRNEWETVASENAALATLLRRRERLERCSTLSADVAQ